jgi:hypothetical protein
MKTISDDISLDELVRKAAQAISRAGMDHRIDIYRDVEVDDPAVRLMLGRRHRVRVRVKITAASLLFETHVPDRPRNGVVPERRLAGVASRQNGHEVGV